ncbi:organic solute transporter subunit beta [Rhinoraja longicauda]
MEPAAIEAGTTATFKKHLDKHKFKRRKFVEILTGLVYLGAHRLTPPTGEPDISGLLTYLVGCFILCRLFQGKTRMTSATMSRPPERIGFEKQNMTREGNNTLAQQFPFPMEDPTNWNYAILALAFVVLFLAFLLLARSSRANKTRKMKALNGTAGRNETEADSTQKAMMQYVVEVDNLAETDPMLQSKQSYISRNQVAQTSSPKVLPKDGQILVEWKDGNVSFLYNNDKQDDV